MSVNFIKLAKPSIQDLTPYQAGKPIEELERELNIHDIIKLASNENPLGPSPKAIAAATHALQHCHLYPDANAILLKEALAKQLNVTLEQLCLGCGSENLLELIAQAFVEEGQEIIMSSHAFIAYPIICKTISAKPVIVETKDWRNDLEAMAKAVTKNTHLIFIANPNNPTGTYNTQSELVELLSNIPEHILVVIDEAYCEYVDALDYPNSIELQKHYPNLISTRTFSKIHALAGLRVGYSIAHPQITNILNRIRAPFNVNSIAQAAALAALEDREHLLASQENNRRGMQILTTAFNAMGISYIPSVANFITIDLKRDSLPIYKALLEHGIIVRPLTPYQMPEHLRITIGTPEEDQRFLEVFKVTAKLSSRT